MSLIIVSTCCIVIGCDKKDQNLTNDESQNLKLTARENNGSVILKWNAIKNVYEYYVLHAEEQDGYFSMLTSLEETSYTDEYPVNGENFYKVIAILNTEDETEIESNVVSCYINSSNPNPDPDPDPDPSTSLSAPTGLNASINGSAIRVSWNYVSNASNYKVYRASSSYGSYSLLTSTSNTYYTDESPLNGSNYYKVKAADSKGNTSEYSDYCYCNYTNSTPTTLSAPTNVTATITGSTMVPNISISWSAVDGATKYNVYRASSASGSYSKLGTTQWTAYSDTNPLNGTNYYKVTAVNSSGTESSKSDYASASYDKDAISPCPPEITSKTANASTNKLTIKWSYPTTSGCGKPTKVTVKIFEPSVSKWITEGEYSATTTTHTFYYGMYQDSDGWVKVGVLVENDYGTAQKIVIYNTKTKQWL